MEMATVDLVRVCANEFPTSLNSGNPMLKRIICVLLLVVLIYAAASLFRAKLTDVGRCEEDGGYFKDGRCMSI